MTKAEMDAIRARWYRNMGTLDSVSFAVAGRHDVPALLDVLNAEMKRADLAEADRNIAIYTRNNSDEMRIEIMADRDHWKARAMALERALREEATCVSCKNVMTGTLYEPCCSCDRGQGNFNNWVFDEPRFAPADTPHK